MDGGVVAREVVGHGVREGGEGDEAVEVAVGSFGYRRLLPFLNKMAAKNNGGSGVSDCKDTPKVSVSAEKELGRSDSGLADESVDGNQRAAAPVMDSAMEPLAVESAADREVKEFSDHTVREEAKVSISAKAGPACCARS